MSILETFYILFKSDSSDVKKGSDEAKKSTDALGSSLKSTNQLTEKVGSSFVRAAQAIGGAVLAFASVGTVIGGIKSAADYTFQLSQASKNLGVSVESLDIWGSAIQKFGGTTEGFQHTLKNLQDRFGKLKDPVKDLYRLADVFSKMSRIRALKIGQQLGLDQGTILLLQQGRKEVDAIIAKQKELGVVTKQDAEIAEKFNFQWQQTVHAFRAVFTALSSAILPGFTKFLNLIQTTITYFRGHKDFIIGGLIAIAAIIGGRLLKAVVALDLALIPMLLWPILIGAVAVAFAILYEDIKAFREGHSSLIGDILNKWPQIGKAIDYVAEKFKAFNALLEKTAKLLGFDIFKKNVDLAIEENGGGLFLSANSKKETKPDLNKQIAIGKQSLDLAYRNPIAGLTSNSISNLKNNNTQSNTIQTGPITINTQATNSEQIATSLSENLQSEMRKLQQQLDNGIYA